MHRNTVLGLSELLKVKIEHHPKTRPYFDELGELLGWFKKMGIGERVKAMRGPPCPNAKLEKVTLLHLSGRHRGGQLMRLYCNPHVLMSRQVKCGRTWQSRGDKPGDVCTVGAVLHLGGGVLFVMKVHGRH